MEHHPRGTGRSNAATLALPISVAVVNDYELIIDGVAGMLRRFSDRAEVVERIVVGEPIDHPPIDVALYDTYGRTGIAEASLRKLQARRDVRHTAMFTLDPSPQHIAEAQHAGASGVIAKSLPAATIVDALVRVASGEEVIATGVSLEPALDELEWPGKADGLSERESQVLILASEGLTNAEIGTALYVGGETVKTHLSRAFSKLGVRNRAGAVRYVVGTGAFERYRPAEDDMSVDGTDGG